MFYECAYKSIDRIVNDDCEILCDKCSECDMKSELIINSYLLFIMALDSQKYDRIVKAHNNIRYLCNKCNVCDYETKFYPEIKCRSYGSII